MRETSDQAHKDGVVHMDGWTDWFRSPHRKCHDHLSKKNNQTANGQGHLLSLRLADTASAPMVLLPNKVGQRSVTSATRVATFYTIYLPKYPR